jgi:tRNA (adenine22-N1)-methyltransferase
MPLSRLDLLVSLIESCTLAVDIGTDHGYLALKLLQQGIAQRVIATDLRPLPLKQAQKTFAQANVFDGITFEVSDGLLAIKDEPDTAILAGMGGDLIIKIITQSLDRFQRMQQIVVQPNSHIEKVRQFAFSHGFRITQERITFEGFYYIALSLTFVGHPISVDEKLAYMGELLTIDDPIYCSFLQFESNRLKTILSQHPHADVAQRQLTWIMERLDGQG